VTERKKNLKEKKYIVRKDRKRNRNGGERDRELSHARKPFSHTFALTKPL
jgi:hypothetical protein